MRATHKSCARARVARVRPQVTSPPTNSRRETRHMSLYQFLIFIHVLGGVALFVAIGIEAVALGRLRRAETPADARVWLGLFRMPGRLGPTAMLTALASGAWMMKVSWGYQPWIAGA